MSSDDAMFDKPKMTSGRNVNRLFYLLAVIVFCCTGCGNQGNQIPPNSFRAKVNHLVEGDDLLVTNLIIEAAGKRTITITTSTGKAVATIEPVQNAKLMHAEVTLVATLVKTSDSNSSLKWLIQIKGQGITVGGPATFPIETDTLAGVFEVKVDQEFHPLGKEIEIGKLQDKPIVLSVK